jgi:threonine dehydratase
MSCIPTAAEIDDARTLLGAHLPVTPLVDAPLLSRRIGAAVRLKLEFTLPTGSFKPRGALYALARRLRDGGVPEVVAASTGNHGAAVAYAGRQLDVPARIFLPERPNPLKRARIIELGARVIEVGADLAGAAEAARGYAAAAGAYLLDDATDPALPAGPATIGVEILEQAPDAASIIVPIGDSALIRGVAAAIRQRGAAMRIIGVQAELAPSYYLSWKAGRVVGTETCATIADGLATRTPVAGSVDAVRELVDDIVLVSDDQLIAAMRVLFAAENIVAEPAGVAAVAAALGLDALPAPVVLLVTGSNVAPDLRAELTPRAAPPATLHA